MRGIFSTILGGQIGTYDEFWGCSESYIGYAYLFKIKVSFFGFLSFIFLPAGSAGLLGLEGGEGGEVDLLLGGGPDQELVGVDEVLADLDVSLMDEDSGLMDGLGLEAFLVDSGLDTLIEELVEGKTQDVIQLELLVGEQTVSVHSVEKGGSFEESTRVFFFEGEEFSGGLSESGEEEMDSPDLTLVLETVLTN